jgi:hypothetical protein
MKKAIMYGSQKEGSGSLANMKQEPKSKKPEQSNKAKRLF